MNIHMKTRELSTIPLTTLAALPACEEGISSSLEPDAEEGLSGGLDESPSVSGGVNGSSIIAGKTNEGIN